MSDQPDERKETLLMRLQKWLSAHQVRLIAIEDTSHSIALGSAIGIFFGFTPLWSMKTLLSIAVAWLFKSNKIAAAIAVTLHDIILPFMPAIYWWEYRTGLWTLQVDAAQRVNFRHLPLRQYMQWTTFFTVGRPLLVGSLFFAVPCAVIVYFLVRVTVRRARTRQRALKAG